MLLADPDTLPLPLDPGFELVAASRGISEGLANSDGPQLVLRFYVEAGPVRAGGQWKNVSSPVADGVAMLFVGASRTAGEAQIGLRAAYRIQTGARRSRDSKAWEFSATAARRVGRFTGRMAVAYSPNDLGATKQAVFIEAGPAVDLNRSTTLSANFGWRWRGLGPDYGAFNAGVSKRLSRQLTVEVRAYRTSRSRLGPAYRPGAIVSARFAL